MKKIITLALICVNTFLFGNEFLSNNAIKDLYSNATNYEMRVISEISTNMTSRNDVLNKNLHITTLVHLRSLSAMTEILESSYTEYHFYRHYKWYAGGAYGGIVTKTNEVRMAIKRVNPTIEKCLIALTEIKSDDWQYEKINFILDVIEENYCNISDVTNRIPDNSNIRSVVMKREQSNISKLILTNKFPVVSGGDTNICQQYDTWQDMLITRFNEEKQGGSTNILGTIDTMAFIRSERAIPILEENLTISPITNSNTVVYPAAEALVAIAPPFGRCLANIYSTEAESINEELWLNITRRLNPEALRYILNKRANEGDTRAQRLN